MKKLALLLIAFPLLKTPAMAETIDRINQLKADQLAQAQTACETNGGASSKFRETPADPWRFSSIYGSGKPIMPSDPHFPLCVDRYLRVNYGMTLVRQADGTLAPVDASNVVNLRNWSRP
jgi:hypothetical protein